MIVLVKVFGVILMAINKNKKKFTIFVIKYTNMNFILISAIITVCIGIVLNLNKIIVILSRFRTSPETTIPITAILPIS